MTVDNVAYSTVEHCIPKKFQPFVVDWFTLIITVPDALVHQGRLIISDVVGIETDNGV